MALGSETARHMQLCRLSSCCPRGCWFRGCRHPQPAAHSDAHARPSSWPPQGNWYTWLSLLLFIVFAGFWMSRYSKAMKLFPVLIIMPIIQVSAAGGRRE